MKIIVPAQKDLLHVTGDYKAIAVNVSKCNGSCTVTQFRDVSMGKYNVKLFMLQLFLLSCQNNAKGTCEYE